MSVFFQKVENDLFWKTFIFHPQLHGSVTESGLTRMAAIG